MNRVRNPAVAHVLLRHLWRSVAYHLSWGWKSSLCQPYDVSCKLFFLLQVEFSLVVDFGFREHLCALVSSGRCRPDYAAFLSNFPYERDTPSSGNLIEVSAASIGVVLEELLGVEVRVRVWYLVLGAPHTKKRRGRVNACDCTHTPAILPTINDL
jgi:hypothetical protein